jgi:hypothetical protein
LPCPHASPSGFGGGREAAVPRRTLTTLALVVLAVLLVPHSAFASKPSRTCPPGFDLGGLTVEQALQLPRIQAGIAAGQYTEADLDAFYDAEDSNGDGVLCWQSIPPVDTNPASGWQYLYNVVDDQASVPSG